jgi:prophage regulatory protein
MAERLYGKGELIDRLGVSRQRVGQIVKHPSFPAPFDVLQGGTVWLQTDVEEWIREHRPNLVDQEPDTTQ